MAIGNIGIGNTSTLATINNDRFFIVEPVQKWHKFKTRVSGRDSVDKERGVRRGKTIISFSRLTLL